MFLPLKTSFVFLYPFLMPYHPTVFSQTQKIKKVCLKRRFQFAGRRLQIENPSPTAWKELAYFSTPLRCTPLRFKKANTFPLRSCEIYMALAA